MKLGKETQKEKVFLNLETFDEEVRAVLMKKNELGETNENRGKLILHGEFAETETNRRRVKDCRLKIVIPQNFEKFTIHIKKHVTSRLLFDHLLHCIILLVLIIVYVGYL